MRRREFVKLLGGAAAVLPSYAIWAQQQIPLVGFLNSASPDTYRFNADSFREGLTKAGFIEGRNVRIEERWARGDYEALPALAAELVAMGVVAIAATGDVASARAAQRATSTVPVVFTIGGDPVRFGLVKSINRPGANLTGVLFNQNVLGAKRVELLRQIAPNMSRVALLMNPANANAKVEQADAEAGAKKLGLETVTLLATNAQEINAAGSARADCFIRRSAQAPRRRLCSAVRGGWRALELWPEHQLDVPPGRGVRWTDSERFKPGGNACPAADAIRAGDQPQNGQGFRPDHSGYFPCPRRRGDRITRQMSAIGTERTLIGDA